MEDQTKFLFLNFKKIKKQHQYTCESWTNVFFNWKLKIIKI
jgi:hypothetical protein